MSTAPLRKSCLYRDSRSQGPRRPAPVELEALEARSLFSAVTLDPTFGIAGRTYSAFFTPVASAVQPNGDVVVVGTKIGHNGINDFAIARFKANGSVDGGFGSGGLAVTPITINRAAVASFATGVNVLSNGKIVVTGNASATQSPTPLPLADAFAAVRYNANGTIDMGFGSGGRAVLDDFDAADEFGLSDTSGSAVLSNGQIIIAGDVFGSAPGQDFAAVAVLNSSGAPQGGLVNAIDPGVVHVPDAKLENVTAVAALPGNKFVLTGSAFAGGTLLQPDGFDQAFDVLGANGSVSVANDSAFIHPKHSATAVAYAVAALPGGGFVTGGTVGEQSSIYLTLAKYTSAGKLDSTFGGDRLSFGPGTVVTSVYADDTAGAVAIESDGKILVADLSTPASGQQQVYLLRYNANGTLDTTFGNKGQVAAGLATVTSVTALAGGKVILVGTSLSGEIEAVRYNT